MDEYDWRGIVAPLLVWYGAEARDLPWRRDTEPYHVWLSEIMLQQTRVDTVIPYYERFLAALPDIPSLAAVDEAVLLKLWEGLGYYSRARSLQKAAKVICAEHGGRFPMDFDAIRALPGIGDYTAGAVSSIAFGKPTPAVDGNVARVASRLAELPADAADPAFRARLTDALRAVYPAGKSGDFTQSLMDLGATVCLPNGAPRCDDCPLALLCRANIHGSQGNYPLKKAKKDCLVEDRTVFLLECGERAALKKRPLGGLLGGLWGLPDTRGALTEAEAADYLRALGVSAGDLTSRPAARHIFTHLEWRMTVYAASCAAPEGQGLKWVTRDALSADYALPTAYRKLLSL